MGHLPGSDDDQPPERTGHLPDRSATRRQLHGDDMSEPTTPSPTTEDTATTPWWKKKWGIAAIVVGVLLILGGVFGEPAEEDRPEIVTDAGEETVDEDASAEDPPEDEAPNETEEPDEHDQTDEPGEASDQDDSGDVDFAEMYGHFDVEPATFVERWNDFIAEIGIGYGLEEFVFDQQQMNMDAAYQDADGWLEVEAVQHPEGPLSSVAIYAEPTTDEQGADVIAMVTAAVHASTGLDAEASYAWAEDNLAMTEDELDPDEHNEQGVQDGVFFELSAINGMWDLYVAADLDN